MAVLCDVQPSASGASAHGVPVDVHAVIGAKARHKPLPRPGRWLDGKHVGARDSPQHRGGPISDVGADVDD
jgi:hypothetical protein